MFSLDLQNSPQKKGLGGWLAWISTFRNVQSRREILNLFNLWALRVWFAKPLVCMRVAFHENDRDRENDEDNSDSYQGGVRCWISRSHGNHGNGENYWNPGCKPQVPQTTGLEVPENSPSTKDRQEVYDSGVRVPHIHFIELLFFLWVWLPMNNDIMLPPCPRARAAGTICQIYVLRLGFVWERASEPWPQYMDRSTSSKWEVYFR